VGGRINDAQRAQQAIFMAVYHWGIHGWVPYILIALCAGLVTFRWKLPMTIRSCFYPLLGDHAWGLAGDFIDALSISTTTFGVCTSLGLGVTQLAKGMQWLKYITCSKKDNCEDEGGVWDISTYGAESCYKEGSAFSDYDNCALDFLGDKDSQTDTYYTIICVITILATLSVLSGLDRGIKWLAMLAFTLGMIVLMTILMADNTWYLLNVMVQTVGYYLNYVMVVGFDCEAFQQLNIEMGRTGHYNMPNYLWGSDGDTSVMAKMAKVGLEGSFAYTEDCGDMVNPCSAGFISLAAMALGTAQLHGTYRMSEKSVTSMNLVYNAMVEAGDDTSGGVPCGYAAPEFGVSGYSGSFPMCPEVTFAQTPDWGTCTTYAQTCHPTIKYYDDSNPQFMDWWTIFYWAWWITWAPFVGFFVALISRGRTVREVIVGGFVMPTLFAILWFSVFGGLAIKMQRVAELALKVQPDAGSQMVTCREHYGPGFSGGLNPKTPESKALAEAGYYMLSCVPKDDQIYALMEPYTHLSGFLHVVLWLGLVIYFLTSSDSGSMTDDVISASGMSADKVPAWQKVFWCWTEGLVAVALINTGAGDAYGGSSSSGLKSLQRLSIIIGLPFTGLLCMAVPSLLRILKKEAGDKDIIESKKFNTQLLDIFEAFHVLSPGKSPCAPAKHAMSFGISLFAPVVPISAALKKVYPESPIFGLAIGIVAQCFWILWFILHIVETDRVNMHVLAWLFFIGMVSIISWTRVEMRYKYNVYGSFADDLTAALFMYPLALSQMYMMAETDGKDAPDYFADIDAMIETMNAKCDSPSLRTSTGKPVEIQASEA